MSRLRCCLIAPFAVAISLCAALFTTALYRDITEDDE